MKKANNIDGEECEINGKKLVFKGVIGKGSSSSVHKAHYDGNAVAVKVFDMVDDDLLSCEIFKQEVSIWQDLHHPNVTKLIGHSSMQKIRSPNRIILEYLPKGNLRDYLEKHKKCRLPYTEVIRLALQLAKGLSYLHSKKVVHGDVKPANVLRSKEGILKITDFGSAQLEVKGMKGRCGTLGYRAPEVAEDIAYNRKCDVFSFGICLWEIYCCKIAYGELNEAELSSNIVMKDMRPQIPKNCPRSIAQIMEKCWDTDPKKRPEMDQVVRQLEANTVKSKSSDFVWCSKYANKLAHAISVLILNRESDFCLNDINCLPSNCIRLFNLNLLGMPTIH